MNTWAAWTLSGDFITTAENLDALVTKLNVMGWEIDEVYAGRVGGG